MYNMLIYNVYNLFILLTKLESVGTLGTNYIFVPTTPSEKSDTLDQWCPNLGILPNTDNQYVVVHLMLVMLLL